MTLPGPATPLGIIAGRGALPRLLADARAAENLPYIVVGLEGFVDPWIAEHPHQIVAITAVRKILRAFSDADCTHVTLAGGVDRPVINPLKLDGKALSWLPKLLPALRRGDDALLRTVRQLLEAEGLTLIGADEVVPMTSAESIPTQVKPTSVNTNDVEKAETLLAALAPHDVGQGVVVNRGLVLGVETLFGTDAMLMSIQNTRKDRGGVLVKRLKVGQDRDIDMPAIGPNTIVSAQNAGLDGIAIEAGGVLILDRDATIAAADEAGIFLWIKP